MPEFSLCTDDELVESIDRLHDVVCAAQRRLLAAAAEYDRRKAWRDDGATSMGAWLAYRLGVSHRTGAEWAKTGAALESLPAIAERFESGALSLDQLAPLTRLATPETDKGLAEEAVGWTAAQCAAAARHARAVSPEEAADAQARRCMRWRWDLDRRMLDVRGQLPDEQGAAVAAALEKIVESYKPDPDTGDFDSYEQRGADALAELASSYLGAQAQPDRATVVIHVEHGVVGLDGGPPLGLEALWRQLCDARVELVGPDGVARARRTPPAWLSRKVRRRDGGCRFPSCERRRWGHVHHVRHWVNGGPTDMGNLLWLCPYHHRLLHEGGWRIEGDLDGEVIFVRPDGRRIGPGPPLRSRGG